MVTAHRAVATESPRLTQTPCKRRDDCKGYYVLGEFHRYHCFLLGVNPCYLGNPFLGYLCTLDALLLDLSYGIQGKFLKIFALKDEWTPMDRRRETADDTDYADGGSVI